MCLIALAWRAHPRYSLVLAANRDEFHQRPAAPAAFWSDAPDVCGGRDLSQGGGWLALARDGRLAAITNVRRMLPPDPAAPSRGGLVADFVRGSADARGYAESLRRSAERYAGFNLLLIDRDAALFLTNQDGFHQQMLTPGVHAVSNANLDTPWPKLVRVRDGLKTWDGGDVQPLFALLADERPAADAELPNTGVGRELERFLSPPFIRGDGYGTRASTVVVVDQGGGGRFVERRFGPLGIRQGVTDVSFQLRAG